MADQPGPYCTCDFCAQARTLAPAALYLAGIYADRLRAELDSDESDTLRALLDLLTATNTEEARLLCEDGLRAVTSADLAHTEGDTDG